MAAVVLALGASLAWGIADFFGPLKARSLGSLRVLVYVELGGLVAIAVVVAARWRGPAGPAVWLALPAAVSGTLGLYAYYRGMTAGAMSIVAPIAGVSAAIPVAVGFASGDRPSALTVAGIACALAGVYLAGREPHGGGSRVASGVGLGLLAAVGFGGYFPFMHAAGGTDFWWASLLFRITSASAVLAVAAIRRPPLRVAPSVVPLLALVGVGDMLGNLLYAASAASGLVSVTAVLASVYPIVTVALARAVLAERVSRPQEVGVVLTLLGVALIAAG